MKTMIQKSGLLTLVAAILLVFASCTNPGDGKGRLELNIAGLGDSPLASAKSTTIFNNGLTLANVTDLGISLIGTGGTVDYPAVTILVGASLSDIPVGTYDLVVTALNSGAVMGTSATYPITISDSATTTQAVEILPVQTGVTGSVSVVYEWPATLAMDGFVVQVMDVDGTVSTYDYTATTAELAAGTCTVSTSLVSGYYLLHSHFTKNGEPLKTVDTIIHVYDNLASTGTITLTQSDFNFNLSLVILSLDMPLQPGNLGIPSDLTFNSSSSILYGSTDVLNVTVPAGFASYKWFVNGILASGSSENFTLPASNTDLIPGTINRLALAVTKTAGGVPYTFDIPFMVTASPFASGNGDEFPYKIETADQLSAIRNYPSSRFVLANNIDLAGYTWVPLQTFSGSFDGNMFAISGLSVTVADGSPAGLFGAVAGTQATPAVIKNLTLTGALVDATTVNTNVGLLAGQTTWANISGCFAEGMARTGYGNVGGLVGLATDTQMTDCGVWFGTGTGSLVMNYNDDAGGTVGLGVGIQLNRCFSMATVQAGTSGYGGGLVGVIKSDDVNNIYSNINQSYANGSVNGDYVGGLAGLVGGNSMDVTIVDCYANGAVSGNYAAALVGNSGNAGGGHSYTNCYATGQISSINAPTDGLIASTDYPPNYSYCFWDSQSTGNTTAGGSGTTYLGSTAMADRGTFTAAGWDFMSETTNGTADIWTIVQGTSYPYFRWQGGVGIPAAPQWATNLLNNPGFETGDGTGWVLNYGIQTANGSTGTDWGLTTDFHTGSYALSGSAGWHTKIQEIDILAKGFKPYMLSGATTTYTFGEYVKGGGNSSYYYMKMTLLDADRNVLQTVENGSQSSWLTISAGAAWTWKECSYTNGFGNLRYIVVESGTADSVGWAGNYAAILDDAALGIYPTAP